MVKRFSGAPRCPRTPRNTPVRCTVGCTAAAETEAAEALIAPHRRSGRRATVRSAMNEVRPWPSLRDEDRWLIEAMEERLGDSTMSPDEMSVRGRELREQAAATEIEGVRGAALALADRWEHQAAARTGAR